ncbi:DUF2927 domain-containing protein [Fuscibacter oryzae]|uniref:DUF2927 domain-containing protein n=1 Tax=Fuscibacter oryzae TaxID=2803939 RepID=A0A8J7SUP0_9RHOB|nr:DUF2927 domain-containing protein [Fuscibacter oryzae]MBL4928712.1 DUF2927 domain-containing protein [Fuscibacter oryzae]
MRRVWPLALALLALPLSGRADDGVPSSGRLSDDDFYRMATCGAPVGGDCQRDPMFWVKPRLTIALRRPQPGFPKALLPQLDDALNAAIAQINTAGAGVTLTRNDHRWSADILIIPAALHEGDETRRIPRMTDGQQIGVGFMQVWQTDRNRATEGSILIAADISREDLPSVMLEELFQSLGFLFDLDNSWYDGRSILAQDSNVTTTIDGQDRMALRRHYPPE